MAQSDPRTSEFLQPDYDAILAAVQDQIDDLVATVSAQQATIDALLTRVAKVEQRS